MSAHVLTGEEADAIVKWQRCGVCECWLTDDEAKNEECPEARTEVA